MLYYGGKREYGPIVEIFIVTIGEIEVPPGPAFPSDFREVRGVSVDGKNYVTCMVADASAGMHHNVIEELVACFRNSLGSIGLSCRNCTEGSEESGVDCLSVVEERFDNVLDPFDLFQRDGRRFVLFHPLNFCAVLDGCRFIGGVLGYCWMGVLIFCECLSDVSRHVCGDLPIDVIPGEFDTAEQRSFPVNCHHVMLFQHLFQVVHVVHVGHFYSKIVNDKAEHSYARRGATAPECVGTGNILWWRGIFQGVGWQGSSEFVRFDEMSIFEHVPCCVVDDRANEVFRCVRDRV